MKKRIISLCFSAMLILSGCATNANSGDNSNTEQSSGTEVQCITVDLCHSAVRNYLDAKTEEDQFNALKLMAESQYDSPALELSWDGAPYEDLYTVSIADNAEFENAYVEETYLPTLKVGHCIPGVKYWYKVEGSDGEVIDFSSFYCKDVPTRFVGVEGVVNMRDIGGWETQSGAKVNYGLLYRSADLKKITAQGVETVTQTLGIKTEIDLRDPEGNDGGQKTCAFGEEYNFFKFPFYCTMYNIPSSFVYDNTIEKSFVDLFEVLSNKDNYPMVFHCSAGADRTGFIAFIINGLLGVSFADLTRDYELTSTSTHGVRARTKLGESAFDYEITNEDISSGSGACWTLMYETIMQDYANGTNDLSLAIENYLVSVGVSKTHIERTKAILLS